MTNTRYAAVATAFVLSLANAAWAHEPTALPGGTSSLAQHMFTETDHIAAWIGAGVLALGLGALFAAKRARAKNK